MESKILWVCLNNHRWDKMITWLFNIWEKKMSKYISRIRFKVGGGYIKVHCEIPFILVHVSNIP